MLEERECAGEVNMRRRGEEGRERERSEVCESQVTAEFRGLISTEERNLLYLGFDNREGEKIGRAHV